MFTGVCNGVHCLIILQMSHDELILYIGSMEHQVQETEVRVCSVVRTCIRLSNIGILVPNNSISICSSIGYILIVVQTDALRVI